MSNHITIELCKEAAALGADAALVISPNYYKKAMQTDRVIEQFFTDVADASPIPVILYNMPGNSGINIPANVTTIKANAFGSCSGKTIGWERRHWR